MLVYLLIILSLLHNRITINAVTNENFILNNYTTIVPREVIKSAKEVLAIESELLLEKYKKEYEEKQQLYIQQNTIYYEELVVVNSSSTKSYMNGNRITSPSSRQYQLLKSDLVYTNSKGHFALSYKNQEFIGVALSSYWGTIGDKFKVTLDSGNTIYIFMLDQKKSSELVDGVAHPDGSVIEMVMDLPIDSNGKDIPYTDYYGRVEWNFNNYQDLSGSIVKFEKVIE